jgi:hypothetical protein
MHSVEEDSQKKGANQEGERSSRAERSRDRFASSTSIKYSRRLLVSSKAVPRGEPQAFCC